MPADGRYVSTAQLFLSDRESSALEAEENFPSNREESVVEDGPGGNLLITPAPSDVA